MKAVFDVKSGSGYDDDIARRYHFPAKRHYLDAAHKALGDWIIYREPQRNRGRRAYIGTARLTNIEPDPADPTHCYAHVADYLEFPSPVPFVTDGMYAEAALRSIGDRTRVGQTLQGQSIRLISDDDFEAIIQRGLHETLAPENATKLGLSWSDPELTEFSEFPGFAERVTRPIERILLNRKIRDANFRLEVCRAYDNRCAVTGLKIINGGGRAEVQAAHIKPVAAGGPDIVQNGIALSATVHWLFDRHLISIDKDYRVLISHNRVPSELRNLFRPENEQLHLPNDHRLWPHRSFVEYHRDRFANSND